MKDLTIGEAARQAGVGVETIRFYERRGLIEQPPKPLGAGFRVYSPEQIRRIKFIRQAQQIGFSLNETKELLSLRADPRADCSAVRSQAVAKLDEVERKIVQLQEIAAALETLIAAWIQNTPETLRSDLPRQMERFGLDPQDYAELLG